ncbi:MAG: hypothetical protein HY851_11535, partial [candidate division Zixibacteria bacterium]|nr:hypothetical protein [candidate division Zixibacteria bacterium]
MDFNQFLQSAAYRNLAGAVDDSTHRGAVDLTRAATFDINREIYLEAESRGLTLSELLETDEYDPTPTGSPLDA